MQPLSYISNGYAIAQHLTDLSYKAFCLSIQEEKKIEHLMVRYTSSAKEIKSIYINIHQVHVSIIYILLIMLGMLSKSNCDRVDQVTCNYKKINYQIAKIKLLIRMSAVKVHKIRL